MMVDPSLQENKLSIKVRLSFKSFSLKILNLVSSFLKKSPVFCEVSYKFALDNFQRSGLDVLFYGQEHNDTLAILSMKDDMTNEKIKDLMLNQKLLKNKDLMIKNLSNLTQSLKECEDYIQEVIVSLQSLMITIEWSSAT